VQALVAVGVHFKTGLQGCEQCLMRCCGHVCECTSCFAIP
jgi:hypothetical protein